MGKKQKKFYTDVRKMLFLYAVIPVVILTLTGMMGLYLLIKRQRQNTAQHDNQMLTQAFTETIDVYGNLLAELADIRISETTMINERYYEAVRRSGKRPDFYLLDENGVNIREPNGQQKKPDNRIIWDLDRYPGTNRLRILPSQAENGVLWLGRKVIYEETAYYMVFAFPAALFETDRVQAVSKIVITDPYGWIYMSDYDGRTDLLNRFRPETKGTVTYFGEPLPQRLMVTEEGLDGRIFIYTIISLKEDIDAFGLVLLAIGLILLVLIVSITYSTKVMADKKTRDIYEIIHSFEQTGIGNLDQHITLSGNDEFQTIGESYNRMVDGLKREIEKNQEKEKLLSDAQMRRLVSQFNPHFLFNTLDNIKYMCKLDGDIAVRMITSMSAILRYSIMDSKHEVVLSEDIEYTENYLTLLKYRFNRRFSYDLKMDSRAADCLVPRLILQPLIENAVKYGFAGRDQLTIRLQIRIGEDQLILQCADDGCGMTAEQLTEVQAILRQPVNKSIHTGLYNINRRIRLIYGEQYGLTVESIEKEGTTITVLLPQREE